MEYIFQIIQKELLSNQFATGGLILGALSAVAGIAYKTVPYLFNFVINRCTTELVFFNDHPIASHVNAFLVVKTKSLFSHRFKLEGPSSEGRLLSIYSVNPVEEPQDGLTLLPGYGIHYFNYEGLRFTYSRVVEKQATKDSAKLEKIELRFLTTDTKAIVNFINTAREHMEALEQQRTRFYNGAGGTTWTIHSIKPKKPLKSLIMHEGVLDKIIKDTELFFQQEQDYIDKGVPYKRVYLLWGPGGTGKSSTAAAVAAHFNKNVYTLSGRYDPSNIASLFTAVPKGDIILIDDIHSLIGDPSAPPFNKVPLHSMLEALDSAQSPEGVVIFITANDLSTIPEPLLRAGRVDLKFYLGYADEYQIRQMVLKFYPVIKETTLDSFCNHVLNSGISVTPSDLQALCQSMRGAVDTDVHLLVSTDKWLEDVKLYRELAAKSDSLQQVYSKFEDITEDAQIANAIACDPGFWSTFEE